MAFTPQAVHEVLQQSTIQDYIRGFSDQTIRERPILELLRRRGRILFNQAGQHCEWRVKYKQRKGRVRGDGGEITRDRHNLWKTLKSDWRSFYVDDRITEFEQKINKGEAAIFERLPIIVDDMLRDIETEFCSQVYVDGDAVGNEEMMQGVMTLYKPASSGDYARDAADLILVPKGEYGGESVEPGVAGGDWSANLATARQPSQALGNDWPNGSGDSHYDWNAPKYIRTNSTSFIPAGVTDPGSGLRWEVTCEAATRMAISTAVRNSGRDGAPDVGILSNSMLQEFKNTLSGRQRFDITVTNNEMADVGFGPGLTFDGVYFTTDFDSPEDYGLLLNMDHMEFRCLDSQLFSVDEPTKDLNNDLLFTTQVYGNFKYDAKFFSFLTPE